MTAHPGSSLMSGEKSGGAQNPLAFPSPMIPEWSEGAPGMTLRDWFAGQALSGAMVGNWDDTRMTEGRAASIATEVYAVADAMLLARSENGQ